MHAAPPVRVTFSRSLGWIAFNAVLTGVATANMIAWALLHLDQGLWPALLAGAFASMVAAWLAWRWAAPAELGWDGQRWQLAGQTGEVTPMIDLDAWLLLRFEPVEGRRRWIAASRWSSQGPWAALRAALYSSRPAVDPPGPQQP